MEKADRARRGGREGSEGTTGVLGAAFTTTRHNRAKYNLGRDRENNQHAGDNDEAEENGMVLDFGA